MPGAGVRIGSLPTASSFLEDDVVAGVQNNVTKKFPISLFLRSLETDIDAESIGAVPIDREINGKQLDSDITLTYADVQSVYDASFAYRQVGNVASKAYTVGKLFTMDGILYRCTVPIAEGSTITEGVNCMKDVFGDLLATFTAPSAVDVVYDNGLSGLAADNLQEATDELSDAIDDIITELEDLPAPKQLGSITISNVWSGTGPYTQTVIASGCTVASNSKVDLQFTAAQIALLISDGVKGLVIENNNGALTLYAVGSNTSSIMTVQCTVEEVRSAV